VWVFARVEDLPAGFHGFHIHAVGMCQPPFTSAGGHFNPAGTTHRDCAGDLPVLLVNEDGSGALAAVTDRFSVSDLRDADGSAVIVHELADNYANIPARYRGPDADTLATGDSGGRIACGVVR
jgi:Cu-Zn family superoxide dismutase